MTQKIYYADPEKQERLEEAIRRGYIIRERDPDGVYRYILTQRGMNRWVNEQFFGVRG